MRGEKEFSETMIFNSLEFAIFMPVVFLLYYAIPHRFRWMFLLASSYYFYMSFKAELIVLIIVSTLVDYYCAMNMENRPKYKKIFLIISLTVNLGLLFFFKYFNFFNGVVGDVMGVIGIPFTAEALSIVLPVGISFYTFQTMSYSIDVYRGKLHHEKHLGYFALYVCFFPQLVAGPIERADSLLPQFREEHHFDYDKVTYGLKLMAWGFFKKLVVADGVAIYVDEVYNNVYQYSGLALVIATMLFAMQIYCDFSGYSDIARGAAKMMGFELMVNFRSPCFLSKSPKEYWQRHHISLNKWFTSYVYIPLGGNRKGFFMQQIFIIITFTLSGLWHGANYTFIVWGLLLAGYNIIQGIIDRWGKFPELPAVIKICATFVLIDFAWIFFRANSMGDALYVANNLFDGIWNVKAYIVTGYRALAISAEALAQILLPLLILFIYDVCDDKINVIERISSWRGWIRWPIYLGFIMVIIFFCPKGFPSEFIYFQF